MSETGLEEKVENMNVEEKEPKAGAKGGGKAKGEKKKKEDPSAFPLEVSPCIHARLACVSRACRSLPIFTNLYSVKPFSSLSSVIPHSTSSIRCLFLKRLFQSKAKQSKFPRSRVQRFRECLIFFSRALLAVLFTKNFPGKSLFSSLFGILQIYWNTFEIVCSKYAWN